MTDSRCSECGCVIPPEANRCPNCGQKQVDVRARVSTKGNGNGIVVGRIGYAITCPDHGRIHITATVASPPTRCPFC